jgi:hypothetical protein
MKRVVYKVPALWFPTVDEFTVEAVICFDASKRRRKVGDGTLRRMFREACLGFEIFHLKRASNDFRNAVAVVDSTPADICRDAARAGSLGGKVNSELTSLRVAPSEDNARIGASSL